MSDVFAANRLDRLLHLEEPYENQRACAHEILGHFRGDLRYALLRAPLQSGKTGSYQYLIRLMLQLGVIDHAYVLCGSHERELLEQVEQDVKDWHGAEALNRTVHVLFRQHFKKQTMVTRRTLIVNDESHLDCQFDQQLHRFLARHGLSMAGTTDVMRAKHTYIVSVSATPFAEESVMAHGDSLPKALVRLQAGDGYYGPMDYHQDGLLRETYSVATAEGKMRFVEEIQRVTDRRKYVLIRLSEGRVAGDKCRRNAKEQAGQVVSAAKDNEIILDTLKEMKRTGQIELLRFTSKVTKNNQQVSITRTEQVAHQKKWGRTIPCLEDMPEVPTVILLDGRLRCGKRVPKKHIGMTWDTSVSSNTDVILQGLVGRMCGYRGREVYHVPMDRDDRPVLYTSHGLFMSQEKKQELALPLSDLERFHDDTGDICPRLATHLVREEPEKVVKNAQGIVVHPCVPIRFFLSEEDVRRLPIASDSALRSMCFDTFMSECEFNVQENGDLTREQKEEIQSTLSEMNGSGSHVRRLQGSSQTTFYRHVLDAIKQRTAVEKGTISDAPFITFCVVFEGYEGVAQTHSTDRAGTVYACIYTEANGHRYTIPLPTRIPRHNGATHFIRREEPVAAVAAAPVVEEKKEADVEAVGVYGFTTAIQDSPAELSRQLSHFIDLARSNCGYFGQEFKAITGREGPRGIRLSLEAYGENLHALRVLISRLEATYQVRITFRLNQQVVATHASLKWIRWEDA